MNLRRRDFHTIVVSLTLLCPLTFAAVIHRPSINGSISGIRGSYIDKHLVEEFAVPTYLKGFVQDYKNDSSVLRDEWFVGLSPDCEGHIREWLFRFSSDQADITTDKEKWVLQMIDAWGKIPEGILSGHVNSFGDYHECIQIEVKDLEVLTANKDMGKSFKGKWCSTYVLDYNSIFGASDGVNGEAKAKTGAEILKSASLEELFQVMSGQGGGMIGVIMPSFAICMPNTCSQEEIQIFFIQALMDTYNRIPNIEPADMPWPAVAFCEEAEKPSFSAGDIFMIVFLSVLVAVSLGAGIIDYWHTEGVDKPPQRGKAYQYLMAFSVYSNTKKLLSTRKGGDDLGCIHGMRFLSASWIVYAHTYAVFIQTPAWNLIDVQGLYENWSLMPIINGTFSVDTFFVMSGMLAAYNILKVLDKTKGKLNIVMFYVHRYIRLTPTYAILVGIMATLVVYVGTGPYWMIITTGAQQCRDNWWTNLLYINNLVKTETMCNGESWYLANDFQFYLLSPLMVYPIWRWKRIGLALLLVYTILSIIAPVLVVAIRDDALPAALMTRMESVEGFVAIYQRPWARIQTFIVGIWLGWILHEVKGKKVQLPWIVALGLWLLNTALACLVIYGITPWFDPSYKIPEVAGYFYAGLSRFTWGIVVAWVIFACVKGYGGVVNKFLSWSAFMPLGRLTFCVYLTSFHLQMIFQARITQPMRYDTYDLVNYFFAHQVMSFLVGYLATLLFESPFIIVQKLMFEGGEKKPQLRDQKPPSQRDPSKRHGIFYNNTDAITNGQVTLPNEKINSPAS